jgi:hypothetical protein
MGPVVSIYSLPFPKPNPFLILAENSDLMLYEFGGGPCGLLR